MALISFNKSHQVLWLAMCFYSASIFAATLPNKAPKQALTSHKTANQLTPLGGAKINNLSPKTQVTNTKIKVNAPTLSAH